MKKHIEQKMGYCACSYPLSGTRNFGAGEHSIGGYILEEITYTFDCQGQYQ